MQSGDLGSLDAFKALFDGVQFRKGLPMSFTATRKGLVTRVDGQEVRMGGRSWGGHSLGPLMGQCWGDAVRVAENWRAF